jgi:hypothetical protein
VPQLDAGGADGAWVATRERTRDLELDHLGAEVVVVALQAGLGIEPDRELLDALAAVGRRADAQGVQVVTDLGVIGVPRDEADRESGVSVAVGHQTCTAATAATAK